MAKFVYIIGTADTKLEELLWLKSCLRSARVDSHIIDVSTGSSNAFHSNNQVDINATQVAAYHTDGIDAVFCGERGRAVTAMAAALAHFLQNTVDDISGLIGIGGSGGTALITSAMQAMPIGIPKLMVSTMASGNVGGVCRWYRYRHVVYRYRPQWFELLVTYHIGQCGQYDSRCC